MICVRIEAEFGEAAELLIDERLAVEDLRTLISSQAPSLESRGVLLFRGRPLENSTILADLKKVLFTAVGSA